MTVPRRRRVFEVADALGSAGSANVRRSGARPWSAVLVLQLALLSSLAGPAATTAGPCEALADGLQDDARSGSDAGDSFAEATPIQKHTDYFGTLLPVALGDLLEDRADVYLFQQPRGERILANVTATLLPPMQVTLVAPSGQVFNVPRISATPGVALPLMVEQDFELGIQFPEPGLWFLSVRTTPLGAPLACPLAPALLGSSSSTNYAMDVDGCRPKCFV